MTEPTPRTERRASRPSFGSRLVDVLLWTTAAGLMGLALWPKDSGPTEGAPSSSFDLPVVGTSERFVHGEKRARPLLIEAFASWCSACRRDGPVLESLQEAGARGQLDIVAISVDDDAADALRAKRSWPIRFPVLHDEHGRFSRDYHVTVLPTYILIDESGQVTHVRAGPAGARDIKAWLRAGD